MSQSCCVQHPHERIGHISDEQLQYTPVQRPGQPDKLAPSYVFLASADSSYVTGQSLHVNGGEIK
ncbi:SDR family oxidoreductase [Paenibacillus thiaminolyticus]|nr:SDR family oxidoreductase [Paenibacillus thiaminolyticus]